MEQGFLLILICFLGNIINVIMEEGVFRGLFLKPTEEKLLFLKSCIFSSVLFGFWHILQPLRNFLIAYNRLKVQPRSELFILLHLRL